MCSWMRIVIVTAVAAVTLGCATSQQWSDWKGHPTHFASDDHLRFSLDTPERATRIMRTDMQKARDQVWWGNPITVSQDQIVEN